MKLDYLVTRSDWQVSEAALGLVLKLDWVGRVLRLPVCTSARRVAAGPLLDWSLVKADWGPLLAEAGGRDGWLLDLYFPSK